MLKPLDDPATVIEVISQASGTAAAEVGTQLLAEAEEIGTTVARSMQEQQIPFYVTSEKLDAFYRDSDAFLYETSVWNTCAAKQRMRDFIQSRLAAWGRSDCDVFCFGDGLGFDSTFLAHHGHRARYFEPSLRCQQYAETVFRENSVSVEMLSSLDDIAPGSLDVVVCLDVLEHIPQPQQIVDLFQKWLKPDGLLFVHAPFWMIHPTRGTHLIENRRYSGNWKQVYGVHGFTPIDSSIFWDPIAFQKRDSPRPVKRTLKSRFNVWNGALMLTLGRWRAPIHVWLARQIARAPKNWVDRLRKVTNRLNRA